MGTEYKSDERGLVGIWSRPDQAGGDQGGMTLMTKLGGLSAPLASLQRRPGKLSTLPYSLAAYTLIFPCSHASLYFRSFVLFKVVLFKVCIIAWLAAHQYPYNIVLA